MVKLFSIIKMLLATIVGIYIGIHMAITFINFYDQKTYKVLSLEQEDEEFSQLTRNEKRQHP